MEFQPALGVCCRRPPEHSGQVFDWWRISNEGIILQTPPQPRLEPPPCPFPLKRSELCWPLKKNNKESDIQPDCEIDMDYWPDKPQCSNMNSRPQTQRVPWKPTKLPNEFGIIKYPPPYTRYFRDRDKLLNFVCKS